jgi:hypothetical protein
MAREIFSIAGSFTSFHHPKPYTMEKLQGFMLLFRFQPDFSYRPSDAELAAQKQQWGSWISGIAVQAKLVSTSQLGFEGSQLRADMSVEEGIHITGNQTLGGNMIVKAESLDDALTLAKGCPILKMGGTVEVRNILPM